MNVSSSSSDELWRAWKLVGGGGGGGEVAVGFGGGGGGGGEPFGRFGSEA